MLIRRGTSEREKEQKAVWRVMDKLIEGWLSGREAGGKPRGIDVSRGDRKELSELKKHLR